MVYLLLVVAMILWSFTFIWYKEVYLNFSPITLVFLRLFISTVLLFLFSIAIKKLVRIKRKDLWLFMVAAMFEPFIYFIGESFGMKLVSSTIAAIIVATIPLFTPLAASFFYKEKLTRVNLIGLVVSIIGVAFVVFEKGFTQVASFRGILLMLVAVTGAIGYSVSVKKLTESYNAFTIVAWQNLLGMIYFAPIFFLLDKGYVNLLSFPIEAFIPVLKMAVGASTIAFLLFTIGIGKIGVTRANMFTNIIPVCTAILSFFMLNEAFTWYKIAGIVIVIAGLFMSQIGEVSLLRKRVNA